ncbi:indole-3-glycerol phosphate synthase [Andreesenia angusta]|uniref:indole-3-glycerol-phosphate synthase n=1 Tax=Andreesenia angusta TaxID=39480 RepID=A0A1S1V9B5_9FIRM|nr:indole-3-glycerol phosphate synthase TrpC [Andreesenia angusta]OHW63211.1 indole-3-glycerol phosphate synthase [Andreesenia angusta]
MNILDKIVEKKIEQIAEEKRQVSIEEMIKRAEGKIIRDFTSAIRDAEGLAIISEIKKASPSQGIIKEDFDPVATAKIYEEQGFDAFSVLTEKHFFLGDDSYIEMVKAVSSKPILRKDFIVDEYQIYQTKAIGGDAILLIASVLKEKLPEYYRKSVELGLHPLVEIHSEKEVAYIEKADPMIIGINNRDLETFTTDVRHTEKILKYLPKDRLVISESGIKGAEDLKYLKSLGVSGALIGESLMRNLKDIKKVF